MEYDFRLRIEPIESVPFGLMFVDDDARIVGASDFIETFFRIEEAALITHVGMNVDDGITSGVGGVAGSYTLTLEGISAAGIADGVIKATTATFAPSISEIHVFKWVPLLASYAAQRGERMCLKLTWLGGGGTAWGERVINSGGANFPYQRHARAGQPAARSTQQPIFGYRTASKRYGFPIATVNQASINSPGQTGIRVFFEGELGSSNVISHITWLGKPSNASGLSYDVIVLDDTLTEIARTTVESGLGVQGVSGGVRNYSSTVYFDDLITFEFGREYFILLAPEGGAQGLNVTAWEFNDATDAAALGANANFYKVSRSGASGSLTRNQAVKPLIDLGFFDWGIQAPPQTGFHLKFIPRYNDNALIEHADDQIRDPDQTVDGLPHEAPGFPIGDAIKSYGGFATVEVFLDPEGIFDASTRIYDERPIEQLKLLNWDPFTAGDYNIVFRLRAAEGSAAFVDVDQYGRLISS